MHIYLYVDEDGEANIVNDNILNLQTFPLCFEGMLSCFFPWQREAEKNRMTTWLDIKKQRSGQGTACHPNLHTYTA